MNDIELLELAAKAAGIMIRDPATKWIAQGVTELDLLVWNDKGGDSVWNPLTDDGDALRLAVKLNLLVDVCAIKEETEAGDGTNGYQCELHKGDPYAATRRAIVRAAAEIGKKK